jgi:putative copper export protein
MEEHILDGSLARGLSFLGLALLTGPATWRLFVTPLPHGPSAHRFAATGAALAFIGASLSWLIVTQNMAGTIRAHTLWLVLSDTLFGRGLQWHLGWLTATIGAAFWSAGKGWGAQALVWVFALGALAGQSLLGHASSQGAFSVLFASHVLHVAGVTAWMGGRLVWAVEAERIEPTRVFEPFRGLALASLAVLIPAGIVNALYQFSAPEALFSRYGAFLACKVLLSAGALVLAAGHGKRVTAIDLAPDDKAPRARFTRLLQGEIAVVLVVVFLAAALAQLPRPS